LRLAWHTGAALSITLLISGGLITASAQVIVYVPNNASNNLGKLTVNSTNGALTPLTPQVTSNFPFIVAATPDNRFLFVGDLGGTIDAFVVTAGGGTTPVGPPFVTAGSIDGLAVDSSGKFVYASNATGNQLATFSINQSSGRLTAIGSPISFPAGALPRGIAADSAGHLYVALAGAGAIAQYTINSTTGALSGGATIVSGTGTQQLAINPAGTFLFASNFNGGTVSAFTINAGAGALTANGSVTLSGGNPQGLAVNPGGNALYVVDNAGEQLLAYSISASGVLTFSNAVPVGDLPVGVTVEGGGGFLYVSNSGAASVTEYAITGGTGLSNRNDFSSGGQTPLFLLARGAPSTPPTPTPVPAGSNGSLIVLGVLLAGSSALLYKRAFRQA